MEELDRDLFFKDAVEGRESGIVTRRHSMKLHKKKVRLEVERWSFGNRVVERWNSLPEDVVNEETVNGFKGKFNAKPVEVLYIGCTG